MGLRQFCRDIKAAASMRQDYVSLAQIVSEHHTTINRIERKVYRDEAKGNGDQSQAEMQVVQQNQAHQQLNPQQILSNLKPGDQVPYELLRYF